MALRIPHSWRTDKYKDNLLFPEMRLQQSHNDCAHCALCPSIEVRNQKVWVDEGEYEDVNRAYRVDIEHLKETNPPPQSPLVIINNITENHQGLIKASHIDTPWPFKVKDCAYYRFYPGAPDLANSIHTVVTHINSGGPAIGTFRVCNNYLTHTTDIVYRGSGTHVMLDEDESPGVALAHSVCITRVFPIWDHGKVNYAFEVLEGGIGIEDKDRLRYIYFSEFDFVFVPIC